MKDTTFDDHLLEKRVTLIKAHPFFMLLSSDAIRECAKLMTELHVTPGEKIVKQGDIIDKLYIISKGSAKVMREMLHDDKINTVFLGVLHEGDAIGLSESDFFSKSGVRTATVVSDTYMTLLYIDINTFNNFILDVAKLYSGIEKSIKLILRLNFIKQIAPFKQMNPENILALAQSLQEIVIPENTYIFRQNDKSDCCYLLEEGEVEILLEKQHGITKLLAKSPNIFGESSLYFDSKRNATVRSKTPCQLLVLPREKLLEAIRIDESIEHWILDVRFKRARPAPVEDIEIYDKVTTEGQRLLVLKKKNHSDYYELEEEGWFLWKYMDGEHPIQDILNMFVKKFDVKSEENALKVIYFLAKNDYIYFPNQSDIKLEPLSIWDHIKSKILSLFIQEHKR